MFLSRVVCNFNNQSIKQSINNGQFVKKTSEFQSDLPVHVNPSPMYPGGQVHVELPAVLVQAATALQPPLFTAHSSISTSSQYNG